MVVKKKTGKKPKNLGNQRLQELREPGSRKERECDRRGRNRGLQRSTRFSLKRGPALPVPQEHKKSSEMTLRGKSSHADHREKRPALFSPGFLLHTSLVNRRVSNNWPGP